MSVDLSAALKIESFSALPGSRGSWTEVKYTIVNERAQFENCEVEIQIGNLETGIDANYLKHTVSPSAKNHYKYRLFLPEEYKKKSVPRPKSSQVKRTVKPKKGKRNGRKTIDMNGRKAPITVLLKKNGNVIHRESHILLILKKKPFMISQLGIAEIKDEKKILFEKNEALHLSKQEVKINDKNIDTYVQRKLVKKYPIRNAWQLNSSKVVVVESNPQTILEAFSYLKWCGNKGLLVLQPYHIEESYLFDLLDYSEGDSYWTKLNLKKMSISNKLTRGYEMHPGNKWECLLDDNGTPYGYIRDWGNGRVFLSNYPINDVFKDGSAQKRMIECLYPSGEVQTIEDSRLEEKFDQWLSSNNGFKVWSKTQVMIFIFSFMIFAIYIIFLSKNKMQPEKKWAAWLFCVTIWSIIALILIKLENKSGMSVLLKKVVFHSEGGVINPAFEVGSLSFVSGEKRKLKLKFPNSNDWNIKIKNVTNKEVGISKDFVEWRNCVLRPGEEMRLKYRKFSESHNAHHLECEVSESLKLSLPKEWVEMPSALIIGRRVWLFNSMPDINLKLSESVLLKTLVDSKTWHGDLVALSRFSKSTKKRSEAILIQFNDEDKNLPFETKTEIPIKNNALNVYKVNLSYSKGSVQLLEGMTEIAFIRDKSTQALTDSVDWFDGLMFQEKSSHRSQEIVFKLPLDCRDLVIKKCKLIYDLSVNPGLVEVELKVKEGGRSVPLKLSKSGEFDIDNKYFSNGILRFSVSPKRSATQLNFKKWKIKHLDIEVEGARG